jgi:hypothetical protein
MNANQEKISTSQSDESNPLTKEQKAANLTGPSSEPQEMVEVAADELGKVEGGYSLRPPLPGPPFGGLGGR